MAANIPAEVQTLNAQDACMKGLQAWVETIGGTAGFTCYSLSNLCKTHNLDYSPFKKQVAIGLWQPRASAHSTGRTGARLTTGGGPLVPPLGLATECPGGWPPASSGAREGQHLFDSI